MIRILELWLLFDYGVGISSVYAGKYMIFYDDFYRIASVRIASADSRVVQLPVGRWQQQEQVSVRTC